MKSCREVFNYKLIKVQQPQSTYIGKLYQYNKWSISVAFSYMQKLVNETKFGETDTTLKIMIVSDT